MRQPNNYGSVIKLSGNRRCPYTFRITTHFDLNGKQHYKYLGYFRTRREALDFQAEYNLSPKDKASLITFTEVFDLWFDRHSRDVKEHSIKSYITAYSKCSSLYDKTFATIDQATLQGLIDNEDTIGGATILCNVFRMVWEYAERNAIITPDKNRTKYLDVPKQEKKSKRYRFTNEEIKVLWDNKDNPDVQTILILIYTGVRPMEYFNLTEDDVKGDYFIIQEGKTENAKREVPIHQDIQPFFRLTDGIHNLSRYNQWTKRSFEKTLEELGISHHDDQKATPYCCRHTFTSLWFENQLNETYRRFIQGHSREGVGEKYYAHIDVDVLKKELDRLPTKF